MNTFSNAFRAEVVRMARKELKPELQGMRKAITSHRSEIAALKRDVKNITSQMKAVQRQTQGATAAAAEPSNSAKASKRASSDTFEFAPEMLAQMRQALGATQLQMAALLAVSPLSYSRWEKGQTQPRAKQLAKIEDVVRMGLVEAGKKMHRAAART